MSNPVVKTSFFRRHTHWWAVAIVLPLIGLAVGLGIWGSLDTYNTPVEGPTNEGSCAGSVNSPGVLYIQATVIAVDTDTLTATLRLDFSPLGNLAVQNAKLANWDTLKGPITLVTTGLLAEPPGSSSLSDPSATPPTYQTASSSYVFLRGEYMQDLDVAFPLVTGTLQTGPNTGGPNLSGTTSARYPWDTYTNPNWISFQPLRGMGPAGKTIPSCVGLTSTVGGWAFSVEPGTFNSFDFSFARSSPVKFYSYFVMGLMWALALGGVAMAVIMIMRKQDEIDTAAFAYLAALLFAFPLIRQTLPGNPGPGSLIDVLAYYWTEVIVALTLVVLLVRWITLKGKHDHPEPDDEVVDPVEPVDPIAL